MRPENQSAPDLARNPAFWGPISVAVPAVVTVIGFLAVASASKGVGGDMVGFGILVYALGAAGLGSVFGLFAAGVAMKKNERRIVFAIIGFIVNLPIAAVGLYVLLRIAR
jgi:hypothetical protein